MAGAAVLYVCIAWSVAPGFYDGIVNPTPYAFTCPPPIAGANVPPRSGHEVIPVVNGVSDPSAPFTDDGQFVIDLLPGAFDAQGKTSVTVDITPLPNCPSPPGVHISTNVYEVTADAPLTKEAIVVMVYSNLVTDPSYVYRADDPAGPWTNIGANAQARLWTIDTKTSKLGYFVAGYPITKSSGGGQLLPATVAFLIVAVLLASIPLTLSRRRKR